MKIPVGLQSQTLKKVNKSDLTQYVTSDVDAFFDQCQLILSKRMPSRKSSLAIGNSYWNHTVFGEMLSDFMRPALRHVEVNDRLGDFSVYSVDEAQISQTLPKPFWDWSQMDPQGYLLGLDPDLATVMYDAHTATFRALHRQRKMAIHWVRDMARVPVWERSFPLRTLINWVFRDSSLQPLHAAAVAEDGDAALITAKGGSGKSSTALNCLIAGMGYLGDDFVLVDTGSRDVFSLYNVVKITHDAIEKFPGLRIPSPDHGYTSDQDKVHLYLHESYNEQITRSAKLKAILVPRIADQVKTDITPISQEEVANALVSSTVYLLKGDGTKTIDKLKRLIDTIPAFYLNLGRDFNTSPRIIKTLLKTL